jgi:hypothetical protein
MRLVLLIPGVLAFAPTLAAQATPPVVNNSTIDYITTITNAIDNMVTSDGGAFLSAGNEMLTTLGIIMLVVCGLRLAGESASRHHGEFPFPALIQFFGLFLIAEALMRYYDAPLPWTNVSVSNILPDTARFFSGTLDLGILDTLLSKMSDIVSSVERPSLLNPLMLFVYALILVDMILIQGVLFAVNILAFVFIGIGSLLGPLFIPWLVVPKLSWLFWNWVQFMLQYSFYRVVASALTYIWATVLVTFIDSAVHGDYSLAHFLLLLVPLGVLNIGLLFSVFKIGSVVSDLFKGAASVGGGFGGAMAGAITGAFR